MKYQVEGFGLIHMIKRDQIIVKKVGQLLLTSTN